MYHQHHQQRAIHLQPWGPCAFPPQIHPVNLSRNGIPQNAPIYSTNCTHGDVMTPFITLEQFHSPPYGPASNSGGGGFYNQFERRQQMNHKIPSQTPSPSYNRGPYRKLPSFPPQNSSCSNEQSNFQVAKPANKPSMAKSETVETNDPLGSCDNLATASDSGDAKPQDSPGSRGLKRQHEAESEKVSNSDEKVVTESPDLQRKRRFLMKTPEKSSDSSELEVVKTIDSGIWTQEISDIVWKVYISNRQSEETFTKKIRLRDGLFAFLKTLYPACGLYIVGSSLTGLGTNSSDLDMCIMLYPHEIRQDADAIKVLKRIDNNADTSFMRDCQVIYAKVPILKFRDSVSGIDVDLNVNNADGIRNTQLLNCYSRLDHRLAPLSIIIKLWAKQHNINDARNMTLSSYSLILMLIHYLQWGCKPSVLPCLQKALPHKFLPEADVRHLVLKEEIPNFVSENKNNLGQLLLGFLKYFGNEFDFDRVMSVRLGNTMAKYVAASCQSPTNSRSQWKYICIEEPFNRTNTARSVFDYNSFQRIKTTFQSSYKELLQTKSLASILNIS